MPLTPLVDDDGAPGLVTREIVVTPEPHAPDPLILVEDAGASDALVRGSFGTGVVIATDPAGAADDALVSRPLASAVEAAGGTDAAALVASRVVAAVDPANPTDVGNATVLYLGPDANGVIHHTDTTSGYLGDHATVTKLSGVNIAAPPARYTLAVPAAGTIIAAITLSAPIGGLVIPAARPAFTTLVDTDDTDARIEITYAPIADPVGSGPIIDAAAPAGLTDAPVTLHAPTALADGVYAWAARIAGPFGVGPWTAAETFGINTLEGQAVAAGTLTVDPTAIPPVHLWHLDPTSDLVPAGVARLAGTGFGTHPTVTLGDIACAGVGVAAITATADAAGEGRQITPGGVIDPYHQQLAFTIPDVDADHPGDAVAVQAGT